MVQALGLALIITHLMEEFLIVQNDTFVMIVRIYFLSATRSTVQGFNFLFIKRVHDPLQGIQNQKSLIRFLNANKAKTPSKATKTESSLAVPKQSKPSSLRRSSRRSDLIIKHENSGELSGQRKSHDTGRSRSNESSRASRSNRRSDSAE